MSGVVSLMMEVNSEDMQRLFVTTPAFKSRMPYLLYPLLADGPRYGDSHHDT